MQAELSCHRVRKVFGKGLTAFEAITAATFSVEKGEFVCLLGPSGCGKSTLLMMIAGLEAVTEGTILANGTHMTGPRAEIVSYSRIRRCCPGRRLYKMYFFRSR